MKPREMFYTVEPVMKTVTKDEFINFIQNYPRPLKTDIYAVCEPPFLTYNDFALANRWPHSVVASTYVYDNDPDGYYYEPEESREYRIMANFEDCFASKTGYKESLQ